MSSDAHIPDTSPAKTEPEAERAQDAGAKQADGEDRVEPPTVDSPEQDVLTLDPDDYLSNPAAIQR